MSKTIASIYISLDGVVEHPAWTAPYWNADLAAFAKAQLFASDRLLLGRRTYEGFAAAWPTMTDEDGFAERMNALPKDVATTTQTELSWNATPIAGDVLDHVRALREQPGGDTLIYGSATLVRTLLAHDLLDELRLWTYPVVRGAGERLFGADNELTLRRIGTTQLSDQIAVHAYGVAR
jgi:dihydrofolate reductase